jgi:DNA-binding beta-propeller fold protein YncE
MRARASFAAMRALFLAAAVLVAAGCSGSHHSATRTDPAATTATRATHRSRPQRPVTLAARPAGALPAPLQDAAAAASGGAAVLLGGLDAADTSTDGVVVVRGGRGDVRGRLPGALHDAAAAALGRSVYLFGGGNGVAQLDSITRVDPSTGQAEAAGRLPAASSDSAAAAVGGTAYVVGGYTGSRWLDTIVAWRPGAAPRIAARLPVPLRYAAVAAADGLVVIAGGSTPAGTASRAVLAFDPRTGRIRRVGTLPEPTTHAAAAALGRFVYVIGGRGAALGTPTDRVVAVDPVARRVRPAGTLPEPRSDLEAISLPGRILVAGGRNPAGTVSGLLELRPSARVPAVARVPALLDAHNVYAADRAGNLTGAAVDALPRVYVPNSQSGTVDVIDPATFKIVDHFAVGALPQHVTPSYDLRTLYVDNDLGNSLTPIDPRTGKVSGAPIPVEDPYNLYFTPDGRYAIVVAERLHRLDFRDAHTMRLVHSLPVDCTGIDHMDFSADGSYAIASCEFSDQLVRIDIPAQRVVKIIHLGSFSGMPQDVKLSPDGRVFYVADMLNGGVWKVNGQLRVLGFLRTGRGAHGLYPSRDSRYLYVTNRGEGSISVVSFRTQRVVRKWWIPGGGSPDMGGVSADGKVLWLSGRYSGVVYAISTRNGRLLARIPVGSGPHGLCVWPQPGRYSLGHTGILR